MNYIVYLFALLSYNGLITCLPPAEQHVFNQPADDNMVPSDVVILDIPVPMPDTVYNDRYISAPISNLNWDQRDLSSMFQLGYGSENVDHKVQLAGATFRSNTGMGGYDGSCQYWQKGLFNFADPGWNPYLVGVGSYFWNNSVACGQCLHVTNPANGNSVVVVVTDYCPPPCSSRQLDLQASSSAFLASGTSTNSIPYKGGPQNYASLQVRRVECDWKGEPLMYWFSTGSSAYSWYIIIAFQTIPVIDIKVEKLDLTDPTKVIGAGYNAHHDKYGRWAISFKGISGAGLYRLTLWGKGQKNPIQDRIYWNGSVGSRVRGSKNFPLSQTPVDVSGWPL